MNLWHLSECLSQRLEVLATVQDLQGVAEENAILMRECAMASLSALEDLESADESDSDLTTPHPEMLPDGGSVTIPDTAAALLESLGAQRFQNKPAEDTNPHAPPPDSDTPRPGMSPIPSSHCDDIVLLCTTLCMFNRFSITRTFVSPPSHVSSTFRCSWSFFLVSIRALLFVSCQMCPSVFRIL